MLVVSCSPNTVSIMGAVGSGTAGGYNNSSHPAIIKIYFILATVNVMYKIQEDNTSEEQIKINKS